MGVLKFGGFQILKNRKRLKKTYETAKNQTGNY